MNRTKQKYYVKLGTITEFTWSELKEALTLEEAKQLADQENNLGEIGMLHLPYGVAVISKKNTKGEWEDVCSPD